jgi:hypothetical protein
VRCRDLGEAYAGCELNAGGSKARYENARGASDLASNATFVVTVVVCEIERLRPFRSHR